MTRYYFDPAMLRNHRKELTRLLAELDQLLAQAQEIADDPTDEQRQSAIDFLAEFEPTRREWKRSEGR